MHIHKKKMEVDVTRARRRKIHVQDFPRQRPDRRRLRRRRSGPKYCDFVYLGFQNLFTEAKKSGFTVRDSQGQSGTSTFVAKDTRDLFLGSWTTTL